MCAFLRSARLYYAAIALLLLAIGQVTGQDVTYVQHVKPLLAAKCSACHGALKQEAELRLDVGRLALGGGESGPAIIPENSAKSLLIERVASADPGFRMPPEGEGEPLEAEQIELLRRWIDGGAKFPADEVVPPAPRDHWAFRPPLKAEVPQAKNPDWGRNPIDAFVAAGHEQRGLAPVGFAAQEVLLRRVYLDLIGLPPTRDQLSAFLADESEDAYEQVVQRLLNSPQYGERWGRHWMDVWRYSDWSGYKNEIRNSQRHIWRWREWIIRSLNADKGYDRMVLEMLAGDELAPADEQVLPATGFLARNWYKFNRHAWLDNTVQHTAKAYLGLTINCARCHDHKYDPLPQQDYYRFRAIFEPHDIRTDPLPGQPNIEKDGLPRAYDVHLQTPTFLFIRGNDKHPDKDHPLTPGVPSWLAGELQVQPIALPAEAYYPAIRQDRIEAQLNRGRSEVENAAKELKTANDSELARVNLAVAEAALASLQARIAADQARVKNGEASKLNELALAAGQAERQLGVRAAERAVLLSRQKLAEAKKASKPQDKKSQANVAKVEKELQATEKKLADAKAALEKSDAKYTPLGKEFPRTSSGRRLALARWIVDRKNPLAARVAVNHIWLRHFGEPLVMNVFDFGLRSPRPAQAELLDWLAVELMENGWRTKHIHRLIVTSNTFRLSSSSRGAAAACLERDPDNRYLWRMNARRLESEAVRDSLLHVAGNLDLTLGGPDIDDGQGQTTPRRSIYFRHAYEKKMKMLELFDAPNENDCYRRSESIVPQQALALANSRLSREQSRLLAAKLTAPAGSDTGPDEAFIEAAFRAVLCRSPSADELAACREFLDQQAARLADAKTLTLVANGPAVDVKPSAKPKQRARENLVHVLMNHNDFVTIR